MSIEEKQVFLIQQSGWKPAQHLTAEFPDRTYAEEAIILKLISCLKLEVDKF